MRQVDIIIPTRNRTAKIIECLSSIPEKAGETKINVVVICDGDPETARLLIMHKRVGRVIYVKEHSGSVYCRNLATQTVEDMVIYFVDDMEFKPDCIEEALKVMFDKFPDGDGVVGFTMENRVITKVRTGFYAGVALVGQKFLKRYPDKKLFYPGYFLFAAQEITNLSYKLGKICMADKALFIHHSPHKTPGSVDKTHLDGRKWKPVDRGLKKERAKAGLLWGDNNESK